MNSPQHRRETILIIVGMGYLLFTIVLLPLTTSITNKVSQSLYNKSVASLDSFFDNQEFYLDIAFNEKHFSYEEIPIPPMKEADMLDATYRVIKSGSTKSLAEAVEEELVKQNAILRKEWEQEFGGIKSLYKIDIDPDDIIKNGWALILFHKKDALSQHAGFYHYYIFPSKIALKKVNSEILKIPSLWPKSISQELNECLDYLIHDPACSLSQYYVKDCSRSLIDSIYSRCSNRYWHILKDSNSTVFWMDHQIGVYPTRRIVEDQEISGIVYKTTLSKSQPESYSLKCDDRKLLRDRYCFSGIIWLIVSSLILFFFRPLYTEYRSVDRILKESLYERLLRICSPSNYFKPYSKDKIAIANQLLSEIQKTNQNDINALQDIRRKAIESLGVSFIPNEEVDELLCICNPTLYFKPYQPEKMAIANELYSRLSSDSLSIEEFEDIKDTIERNLLNDTNSL